MDVGHAAILRNARQGALLRMTSAGVAHSSLAMERDPQSEISGNFRKYLRLVNPVLKWSAAVTVP
jgi:hypothetical protein